MRFEAMVLAAGLGQRLRPYTDDTPKALIDVAGRPILGRIVSRLSGAGASRIVVNVHHHADQIRDYLECLQTEDATLCPIVISNEAERPLETGGGILRAGPLFGGTEPIMIQNVDVISGLNPQDFVRAHLESGALATLAVSQRPSSRTLWFDELGLCGRDKRLADGMETLRERVRSPVGSPDGAAFAGLHVVSPNLLGHLNAYSEEIRETAFSVTDAYLWLAGLGEPIRPYDAADALWLEVGTPERLEAARRILGQPDNTDQP
ncbi:MAG: sugar phosphate nucleotidyltransferase [Gemmatimonadota bacterium]